MSPSTASGNLDRPRIDHRDGLSQEVIATYTNLMARRLSARTKRCRLPMHVAFVLPRFFPYRGGYENSVLALSKYLVQRGHRVTVFTTVANDLEAFWLAQRRTFPGSNSVDGVVVRRFPICYNVLRRRATRLLGLMPYWRWKHSIGRRPSAFPDCRRRCAMLTLICFTSVRCPTPA